MKKNLKIAVYATAILWGIFLLNYIFVFYDFRNLGIRPRTVGGLVGIAASPFLHGGLGHIISNSIPFFILLLTLLTFYKKIWIEVSVGSAVIGGFMVWLMARGGTNHIGMSGVIFSYIAFFITSGVLRRDFKALSIALVIFFLYGFSLLRGIIPGQPGISWEGHLFGAVAGVILAWVYKGVNKKQKPSGKIL